MIKGIIFDLDGTLLDTMKDLATACNETMKEYGFNTFSVEEISLKVGNGNRKLIERCLPEGRLDLLDEAVDKFCKHYEKCYLDDTVAFDGIIELLNELENRNIKVSVNTNKFNQFCENLLKDKIPEFVFFRIIGSRDNIPNKPDPYSANEIIDDLGVSKNEMLYVGDSDVDIKTGKNAGIKTVFVTWGSRSIKDVEHLGVDYIIDKPDKLLDIIDLIV